MKKHDVLQAFMQSRARRRLQNNLSRGWLLPPEASRKQKCFTASVHIYIWN